METTDVGGGGVGDEVDVGGVVDVLVGGVVAVLVGGVLVGGGLYFGFLVGLTVWVG